MESSCWSGSEIRWRGWGSTWCLCKDTRAEGGMAISRGPGGGGDELGRTEALARWTLGPLGNRGAQRSPARRGAL
eukprot:10800074-Lingulodinium_polyedra.AAC.1